MMIFNLHSAAAKNRFRHRGPKPDPISTEYPFLVFGVRLLFAWYLLLICDQKSEPQNCGYPVGFW